jgi:hypothetical protein
MQERENNSVPNFKMEPVFTYLKIGYRTYTSGTVPEFMMTLLVGLIFTIKENMMLQ